ncbi:MAG TPA: ABC transporter permease [Bacillota bacterium]|nr:ABC transporter permease [Bacillota bacterium]
MSRYLLKRLLMVVPVMLGVSLIVFLMMHVGGGDPALLLLGERATEQELYTLRRELGLLEPMPVQFGRFLLRAIQGDLGRSIRSRRPVVAEISDRMPATIQLASASMLVATVVGVTVGVISAVKPNTLLDDVATTGALAGLAMPVFWMGLMLQIVFAVHLGWLPASGRGGLQHLILPGVTLSTGTAALLLRMTRSAMLEIIRMDYIRTARSKGLGERVVIYRHALRNALVPVVTVIGLAFAALMGGAVITESVFAWPGVGAFAIDAIRAKDMPVVQGAVLMLAFAAAAVNLVVDVVYVFIDPRIRT